MLMQGQKVHKGSGMVLMQGQKMQKGRGVVRALWSVRLLRRMLQGSERFASFLLVRSVSAVGGRETLVGGQYAQEVLEDSVEMCLSEGERLWNQNSEYLPELGTFRSLEVLASARKYYHTATSDM